MLITTNLHLNTKLIITKINRSKKIYLKIQVKVIIFHNLVENRKEITDMCKILCPFNQTR